MTKECRTCGEVKPLDGFTRKSSNADGLHSMCKVCRNEERRMHRAARRPSSHGLELVELGWAPQSLEEAVKVGGLCSTHPNPEWWTMNRPTHSLVDELVPYEYVRRDGRTDRGRQRRSAAWHARRVCEQCPVRTECRELIDRIEAPFPHSQGHLSGVWAGETPQERVNRRGRSRAAA